jgi:DNA-binding response OmpR family regulator
MDKEVFTMKGNIGINTDPRGADRQPQILLVDDELTLGRGLEKILHNEGYNVDYATTGQGALDYFGRNPYDLLVTDLRLQDIDGLDVVKEAKGKNPELQVIIITGYGSVPSAVNSMKLGAFDYLSKPFTKNEFVDSVQGALKETYAPMLRDSVEKQEMKSFLEGAAQYQAIRLDAVKMGFEALGDYQISNDAKTAINSKDLEWIDKNIGQLSDLQLRSILTLLETEATFIERRKVAHVLDMTAEAKAAILEHVHVGELSEKQLRSILSRLETEA